MRPKKGTSKVLNAGHSPSTLVLIVTLIAIPLFLSPHAQNAFRLPKELLLRLSAILLVACGAMSLSRRRAAEALKGPVPFLSFTALVLGWALMTTFASTNRQLSFVTMLWVISCSIFFVASHLTARGRTLHSIEWVAVPTVINVVIYATQELGIWRPFGIGNSSTYHGSPALLGTPDDVAVYLVPAALASLALWKASDRRKTLHLIVAAASVATVFWSRTLTAAVALVIALFVAALFMGRLRARMILAAALVVFAVPFAFPLLRQRVGETVSAARSGDYDRMLAGRALPWAAGWEMVKAHPLTGVGPGCYSWQYFPFRREAESRIPSLLSARMRHSNFGEAHNDQLQLAATAGIPAYALLLIALWLLARCSIGGQADTPEKQFSRLLGAPLAAAMFMLTLAQFPMELGAPMTLVLYLSGSISTWSRQA